jgi:hypothetical protein
MKVLGDRAAEHLAQTGRNIRSVWTIATAPYADAHFATFPPELAERCIKAGTSERGCCAKCGAPWVRVVERERVWTAKDRGTTNKDHHLDPQGPARSGNARCGNVESITSGWQPSCACDAATVPATVLDPFAGASTTLLVAERLQRRSVGIELSPAYVAMSTERLRRDAPLFAA